MKYEIHYIALTFSAKFAWGISYRGTSSYSLVVLESLYGIFSLAVLRFSLFILSRSRQILFVSIN
jgi:hypothetical protein